MAKKVKAKDTVKDSFVDRINAVTKETANDLYVDLNESELSEAVKQELNIALQAKLNVMEQAELDAAGKPLDEAPVSVPSDESAKPKAKGSLPSWVKAVSATEEQVMKYQEKGRLYGHDPVKGIAYILTTLLMCFALVMPGAFAASTTDEAVLGNGRWSVQSDGDLVPNANTYSIGSATQYPASIWVNGAEYSSFAAGSDGNWTDQGLTVTLDAAPTKFIATKSSGDMFATGFTVGTGDITFANGQKIDGDTAETIKLIEASDTLTFGFTGSEVTCDTSDGGFVFLMTQADGYVDFKTNNDNDDYLRVSTVANVPTIVTAGTSNLEIAPDGGTTTVTGALTATGLATAAGVTTSTTITLQNSETIGNATNQVVAISSNAASPILQVLDPGTSNTDATLRLSADASADNGDDWDIVSDGATNSLLFQNDTSGSQATMLTIATTGLVTTTGDITVAGTTPLVTIGDGGDEDAGVQINSDTNDFYIASENSVDSLIIGEGSSIGTTPIITLATGGIATVTGATDGDLTVYGAGTSASDAYLRLVGDAGADASDRWQLFNDSSAGSLLIQNDSSVAGTYVTKLTVDSAGLVTTTGDVTVAGTTPLVTVGDGGDEDAGITFNSDTQDYYIASENAADSLMIGVGSSIGTTPAITVASDRDVTFGTSIIATQYIRAAYFSKVTRPASGAPIGSIILYGGNGAECGNDGTTLAVCVSNGTNWIPV